MRCFVLNGKSVRNVLSKVINMYVMSCPEWQVCTSRVINMYVMFCPEWQICT